MVARACACGAHALVCVRESVRAFVCVCVIVKMLYENSQTYFCKHPTFINIHVTKFDSFNAFTVTVMPQSVLWKYSTT